jgi:hypothetical protein
MTERTFNGLQFLGSLAGLMALFVTANFFVVGLLIDNAVKEFELRVRDNYARAEQAAQLEQRVSALEILAATSQHTRTPQKKQ